MTTWETWRASARPLTTGGLEVATYDLGNASAPPSHTATFLHGYPSSALDIGPVVDRLGDRWRVLALDFPGFGASAKPPGHPYSIHAAADAVEDLWRARELPATVLVSHDYGVSVGQELLARREEGGLGTELTATVWMNGGLYPQLHRPSPGQQLLLDPEHGAEVAAAMDEGLFAGGIRGTWGTRREMTDAELHEMWCSLAERDGSVLAHELLHYVADRRANEERWTGALERCDLPMRFVWGDLDPVSGAHMIEEVARRVPGADIRRFADVGHWPLLEVPDDVTDAILASA